MPGEAVAIGAVANVLPLQDIAGRLKMLAEAMEAGKVPRSA
jgi:chemotaxis response regulator CheB